MEEYDFDWFLSTPFGAPFDHVSSSMYDMALPVAQLELSRVLCYCPSIYPTALAIKLAILLSQWADVDTGPMAVAQNAAGKRLVVIEDQVYDTKRKYAVLDADEQVTASSPANVLADIVARCQAPVKIGAQLIASNVGRCGPCSSGYALWYADKSDG